MSLLVFEVVWLAQVFLISLADQINSNSAPNRYHADHHFRAPYFSQKLQCQNGIYIIQCAQIMPHDKVNAPPCLFNLLYRFARLVNRAIVSYALAEDGFFGPHAERETDRDRDRDRESGRY